MAKSERMRAKQTAWKWFSLYIRLRDCQRTMDSNEFGSCISCGEIIGLTNGDAGHFIPGRSDSVLYEETNCHLQCKKCNRFLQGNFVHYEFALRRLYGHEEVERLKRLIFTVKKYNALDYRNIANEYRAKYKALKEK